jgi:sarcosine oxidase subunit gamma
VSDLDDAGIGSTKPGHYGAQTKGVQLSEATIAAAWNLQGNVAQQIFADCAHQRFGIALPHQPNSATARGEMTVLSLGPRSWLLIESPRRGNPPLLADISGGRDAVNAAGGALFDVSVSRIAYRVNGTHAETVLSKSCPLDFDTTTFPTGACAQSLFGRINALFYRPNDSTFLLLVARSLARDAWRLLCHSSAQYGYEVVTPDAFGVTA